MQLTEYLKKFPYCLFRSPEKRCPFKQTKVAVDSNIISPKMVIRQVGLSALFTGRIVWPLRHGPSPAHQKAGNPGAAVPTKPPLWLQQQQRYQTF
jgi:hypothetical protein